MWILKTIWKDHSFFTASIRKVSGKHASSSHLSFSSPSELFSGQVKWVQVRGSKSLGSLGSHVKCCPLLGTSQNDVCHIFWANLTISCLMVGFRGIELICSNVWNKLKLFNKFILKISILPLQQNRCHTACIVFTVISVSSHTFDPKWSPSPSPGVSRKGG